MERDIPFPEVVDATILNAFRSCPRKAELMYFQHWKGKSTNIHLHAGKVFATGCEITRRAFYGEGKDAETARIAGFKAMLDAWGTFEVLDTDKKSLDRMCGAHEYFFTAAWPLETDSARPKIGHNGPMVEFSFAEPLDFLHPVTRQPIIYSGRADMIVEMANGVFIEDDKTTSSLGARWASQWEMRPQFTGYCWAGKRANIDVDGVLVRGVSILKGSYEHAQAVTWRPQWEIDRWYEQIHIDLARMQEMWERRRDFDYHMGEACNEYGGCPFLQICKKPNPEDWLSAYFHQKKWNPLTREEEDIPENEAVQDNSVSA